MKKMWSGRFSKEASALMDAFNSSLSFDKILYKHDIQGSMIHAEMLKNQNIISSKEYSEIKTGLKSIIRDIENGTFILEGYEDIHMAVEAELTKRIGKTGGKLHTARSRNDQVITDLKLWIKESIENQLGQLKNLLEVCHALATNNQKTILPGFTHLQAAQPITLGFYFMSWFFMFERDLSRLRDCYHRLNVSPLGSGAFAGVNYEIDRDFTAAKLGFKAASDNAMDSVCDRDFIIEYLSTASILMSHLSRLNEELIIWSNKQFDFITLDDAWATGSSIMPNKKNPDASELIRGKSGRVFGSLISLLTTVKSLPLAYNKDLQEDKEPLFDTTATIEICLEVIPQILTSSRFNPEKMISACENGFIQATDVADYLTTKGVPFREAHEVSGAIVGWLEKNNRSYSSMSTEDFKQFSELFEADIHKHISFENIIKNKKSAGSTGYASVKKQLRKASSILKKLEKKVL